MVKYIIIHNTHNGCYDFQCYQDEAARIRLTSITINPPKIFLFNSRDEAQDFFEEYINDVDCIDIKCKKGDDVEHVDYCTCGIIELDDKGEPILFYNKKNQIFLMEHGPQVFLPNQELKNDIRNLNLTNKLIRKCKSLSREQKNRYIELGKYCEECNDGDVDDEDDDDENGKNIVMKENEVNTVDKEDKVDTVNALESKKNDQAVETKKKTYVKRKPKTDSANEENQVSEKDKEKEKEKDKEKKKKTYTKKSKTTPETNNPETNK
jgi:hypothetical protein